ncbi:MAG: hypothetical protein AB9921_00765 [Erysipelotrichaceae bacterium]
MIIEVLYPEVALLYGDRGNVDLLKHCLPNAEFVYTGFDEKPAFVDRAVDLILMGPSGEKDQLRIIECLKPYVDALKSCIENGTHILLTGNALDAFGMYILDNKKERHEALGLFDFYATQDLWHRYNGYVLGTFNGFDMVGHKSQFSMLYGNNVKNAFFEVNRGIGINPDSKFEGIHLKNLYATAMIGPILALNPKFTRHLLMEMNVGEVVIPFEKELMAAYDERVSEFKRDDIKMIH